MNREQQPPTKLLLTVTEAAARLGIGRTLMYELISTGAMPSVRVGRLRRIRAADLETYTAALAPSPVDRTDTAA
jgi:excisionase family DNA binding protein